MDIISSPTMGLILGYILCFVTALGTIGYEYIVDNFSFRFMLYIKMLELVIIFIISIFIIKETPTNTTTIMNLKNMYYIGLYIISSSTVLLWYILTKKYGALVTATFELKYVIVLGVISYFASNTTLTWKSVLGISFAVLGSWLMVSE